jgi:hypothetical protein
VKLPKDFAQILRETYYREEFSFAARKQKIAWRSKTVRISGTALQKMDRTRSKNHRIKGLPRNFM